MCLVVVSDLWIQEGSKNIAGNSKRILGDEKSLASAAMFCTGVIKWRERSW